MLTHTFCAIRLALAISLSMDFFLPPRLNDDSDRGNRDKKAGVNDDCGACTLAAAAAAAAAADDDSEDDISVDDVIGLKCNKVESCNESKKVSIFCVFFLSDLVLLDDDRIYVFGTNPFQQNKAIILNFSFSSRLKMSPKYD